MIYIHNRTLFRVASVIAAVSLTIAAASNLYLSASAQGTISGGQKQDGRSARSDEAYGHIPLSFEANRGQADPGVEFLARGNGYSISFGGAEALLSIKKPRATEMGIEPAAPPRKVARAANPPARDKSEERISLALKMVGANGAAEASGVDELPGRSNYFIGNDESKWRTDIPTYAKVMYKEVYPGIDVVYYGNQRQLEYDFIVAPGGDPNLITVAFESADSIELNDTGDLILHTGAGKILQKKPFVYQEVDGERREVISGYAIKGADQFGFQVGSYDPDKPLVIDPVLAYSTFVDFSLPEDANIALDSAGNLYLTGSNNGNVYVAKVNPSGTGFVFTASIGGTGSSGETGTGIGVDAGGNVIVGGDTWSRDFPTVNAFQPALASVADNDSDAFVLKLSPNGSSLLYSTYLGGSDRDDGYALAVDPAGNAYITGYTESPVHYSNAPPSPRAFPTTPGAFQRSIAADNDAFLTKFNASGGVVFSTYLGGVFEDLAIDVAVDSQGYAYVTGVTDSPDFPVVNALQGALAGVGDTFLTKFTPDGSGLVYSTYLGGSAEEICWAIALDASKNVYLTGYTYSYDFPTLNPIQRMNAGSPDAFVTKINSLGSALVYSTYLGGSESEKSSDIYVDSSGAAYIIGYTRSLDYPTARAFQAGNAGGIAGSAGTDALISKIDPSGTGLVYSTYLGAATPGEVSADYGVSIVADSAGNAYVAGTTHCANFPVVNALQPNMAGESDSFLSKISEAQDQYYFQISGIVSDGIGNPIGGATVALTGAASRTVQTTSMGAYAFIGLPAGGSYSLTAAKPGLSFSPERVDFTNLSGDRTANFNIARSAYNISGRVTDASNGAGIGGVTMSLTGSLSRAATTADDGSYLFQDIPAGSSLTLQPAKPGYTFNPQSMSFPHLSKPETANFTFGIPNVAPEIELTSPQVGAAFDYPASISLAADASDSDGTVSRVIFYANGGELGVDTSAPYHMTFPNAGPGNHQLRAIVIDNLGKSQASRTVTVIVRNSGPAVTLTSPTGGASFQQGSSISMTANASDNDGTIRYVSFYAGPMVVGQAWEAPYAATWMNAQAGSYDLKAVAVDNNGAARVSNIVRVSVGDGPATRPDTVGVFRPSNGALYLKNVNSDGFADMFLTYGLPGDYPVTGDWDGDGIATIGVYRDGTFHLRNTNTNGFADIVFTLGVPEDYPIAGDWDGL